MKITSSKQLKVGSKVRHGFVNVKGEIVAVRGLAYTIRWDFVSGPDNLDYPFSYLYGYIELIEGQEEVIEKATDNALSDDFV